ncbi:hypothetical protein, partial [Nocardia sp. NPDC050789]|uniref:hypothetical protein n=1 Tax=Nocardia sp. NPDC050789 TaxID=3154841 RepID=UPI0033D82BD0
MGNSDVPGIVAGLQQSFGKYASGCDEGPDTTVSGPPSRKHGPRRAPRNEDHTSENNSQKK